jgi:hypothetical protein
MRLLRVDFPTLIKKGEEVSKARRHKFLLISLPPISLLNAKKSRNKAFEPAIFTISKYSQTCLQ